MAHRFLTPEECDTLFRLSGKLHRREIELPPSIIAARQRLEQAIRNAESFYAMFRIVDRSLVNTALEARFDLDRLYSAWTTDETEHPTV